MGELIGYASCSTLLQDLTSPPSGQALVVLGVPDDRIYLDKASPVPTVLAPAPLASCPRR